MNFDTLTDDQLVELLRAGAAEATRRGVGVATAAKSAMLSEAEKADIAAAAAQRTAQKLRDEEIERIAKEAEAEVRAAAAKAKEAETLSKVTLGCIDEMLPAAGYSIAHYTSKSWCKTVDRIDRTKTNGFSLVGDFVKESQTLNLRHCLYVYCGVDNKGNKKYRLFAIRPGGKIEMLALVGDTTDWAVKLWPAADTYLEFMTAKKAAKAEADNAEAQAKLVETQTAYEARVQKIIAWKADQDVKAAEAEAEAKIKAEAEAVRRAQEAEEAAARRAARTAAEAEEKAVKQEKLRTLLQGQPVLVSKNILCEPVVESDITHNLDNGRRTLVAVRPDATSNAIMLCTIVVSGGISLGRWLTEQAVTVDALPEDIAKLLDEKQIAALTDAVSLPEIERDTVAKYQTTTYSQSALQSYQMDTFYNGKQTYTQNFQFPAAPASTLA